MERTHLTIKNVLYKQKGGIGDTFRSPKDKLNTILFILNFLTLDKTGKSAADRHASAAAAPPKPLVLWKDILTGKWNGPDPVLVWSRGSVCVFPQEKEAPIWIPERLVRAALPPNTSHDAEDADDNSGDATPSCGRLKPESCEQWLKHGYILYQ